MKRDGITRKLKRQLSRQSATRWLQQQKEAVAHIHVQRLIDTGQDLTAPVTSVEYLTWIHGDWRGAFALLRRAFPLLRDALHMGEIERSRAADLLGVGARQARNIVTKLIEKELLVSAGPGAPLRLGFPATVVEWWFPKLYPELRNP